MKIEAVEILLVCSIVAVQVYVFARTYRQIKIYKNSIPDVDSLLVSKIFVKASELGELSPKTILANVNAYKKENKGISYSQTNTPGDSEDTVLHFEQVHQDSDSELTEVNIIEKRPVTDTKDNTVFDNIFFSVNNYLIRNCGAASDFNLIKDIVERNTDAVEEDINLSISVPLYLGLMGTMIGIVIGLFNMPDLSAAIEAKEKDLVLNNGIALLIGGVKIAMVASFIGLLFTIINSGWVFKGARSYTEAKKNEFYTFVQIELLPIINQGLASTLESLQRNLLRFNTEFSGNLKGLTGIFDANRNTIREQKELLDALDKAKVSEMTRYNVAVLKQLDVSVGQFEKFNAYLGNVTQFVENSQLIVGRTNELLTRTDKFGTIADSLENRLNQSEQLLTFLSAHFNKLEEHKEFTSNAVANVGHSISETFKELKEHIQNSSETVKQFTVDETEALKDALSASKTNLSNLEHLASLKTDVSQFKTYSASQGEQLRDAVDNLNKSMAKSIEVLEQIEKRSFGYKLNQVFTSIKSFFKSRK